MNTKQFYSIFLIGIMLLLISFLIIPTIKASETLFEYYNINDDNRINFYGSLKIESQTFHIGTVGNNQIINITSVKVKLLKSGSPTGTIYSYLYYLGGASSNPVGTFINPFDSMSVSTLTTTATWYEFDIPSDGYILNKDSNYAIGLCYTSGDALNYARWRCDTTSPTYSGGNRCYTSDGGLTWTHDTGTDYMFEIYGKNVYNETITVYENLVNCTGTYQTNYTVYNGFKIWNNYSSYANLLQNIINSTGTHQIICNNGIYKIWANYTGYSLNTTFIQNLYNCFGTNETTYNSGTGFTIWENYTGYSTPQYIGEGGKWKLSSIPYNETISKYNVNISNSTNWYNWTDAVTNNIILNFLYGWNETLQNYMITTDFLPYKGYWIYFYNSDYNLTYNFTCGNGVECEYPFYFNYSDENITINITVTGCENVNLDNSSVNETNWINQNGFGFNESTFLFIYLFALMYFIYNEKTNELFLKSYSHMIFIICTLVLLLGIEAGEFVADFGFSDVQRMLLLPFVLVFIGLLWLTTPFSNKNKK